MEEAYETPVLQPWYFGSAGTKLQPLSKRRSQMPGREFVFAVAEQFALGALP
jgi:hypothetical protein